MEGGDGFNLEVWIKQIQMKNPYIFKEGRYILLQSLSHYPVSCSTTKAFLRKRGSAGFSSNKYLTVISSLSLPKGKKFLWDPQRKRRGVGTDFCHHLSKVLGWCWGDEMPQVCRLTNISLDMFWTQKGSYKQTSPRSGLKPSVSWLSSWCWEFQGSQQIQWVWDTDYTGDVRQSLWLYFFSTGCLTCSPSTYSDPWWHRRAHSLPFDFSN